MFFLGVDIGKRNHEAALVNEQGKQLGKSIRFSNTKHGSEQLLKFINQYDLLPENTMIGMEATGHYWLAIYSFLVNLDFHVTAFNPIQSDTLRSFYIRKTKTDSADAVLIAQVIRMDLPDPTHIPQEDIFRLKQLERFRYSVVDNASDLKRKIISCLDQVFPEYTKLFSDMFGKSSTQLLLESPLPEDLVKIDSDSLIKILNKASEGRLGLNRAEKKAKKIKDLAFNSFGISVATDVFKLEIQMLLEQIQLFEKQLIQIEKEMAKLVAKQKNYLTTITGIGPVTAAVLMGEIGDIQRFERPNQLLAFAGLDASVRQSGDFTGTKNKLSKRGSPYLRRALWQAAFVASQKDPALSHYYQKLRTRGKSHGTAVGAVARKLVNIIFAVWTSNRPYEVRMNP
ncbi:IS110 family transposase [Bacillus thuringiensis]|nr:IS110 family transposase [Bacillus thuringiensis]MED2760321.1 IS110 family transposase [Bacillus thuringiensis]MED2768501.1 IS110 family transposase [Bacillus thuringiensis]MED2777475.1 IS110 family transposase [Bacillus thuringiensis]MED2784035.1 IS110 family transposase [Bacillus thuringiensis]